MYCAAYEQYQGAENSGGLDEDTQGKAHQAYLACYPPTATPEPIIVTTEPAATEPPATEPPTTEPRNNFV